MKSAKLALMLLSFALTAAAQTTGVTGTWRTTWIAPGDGAPNNIALTQNGTTITGTYTESVHGSYTCPVNGAVSAEGDISLDVKCSGGDDPHGAYEIQMLSTSVSDLEIEGVYRVIGYDSHGSFKMEKLLCFLPEGCTNTQ